MNRVITKLREKKLDAIFTAPWWRITKDVSKKLWIERKIIINLSLFIFFIFNIYAVISSKASREEITRCGILVDKKQPTTKSGTIKNKFYVRYNDNNEVETINVTNTCYYDNKIGKNICFGYPDPETKHDGAWNFGFVVVLGIKNFLLNI